MNQVPLNIDFSQILLHLFNVVILFAILYFLIYKPVRNFMEKAISNHAMRVVNIAEADELVLSTIEAEDL